MSFSSVFLNTSLLPSSVMKAVSFTVSFDFSSKEIIVSVEETLDKISLFIFYPKPNSTLFKDTSKRLFKQVILLQCTLYQVRR